MRFIASLTIFVLLLVMQAPSRAEEAAADQPELLDQGQLDQLVAPIALYPDPLLAQVLIASTYPLEVVQAERWLGKNKGLEGDALNEALAKEDWDDSIKSLVAVPDVLTMMNDDLDWTSKLGDAVLAQQADVMGAVQRLRAIAQQNGKLESNEQQTVTVKQEVSESETAPDQSAPVEGQAEPQQVIVIEPTSPETIYVPYYEPAVVYGTWPYPDYPPYYFAPRPGYIFGGALASGLAWSAGFAIGNAIWGDGFDWYGDNIRVNVNRNVNINNTNVNVTNWKHNSYHRRGVNYKNADVRNKFSKGDLADKKPDFRGRDGLGDLGDKRPRAGDLEAALKKKPGIADKKADLAGKQPDLGGGKKPDLADKKANLAGKKPELADKKANLADKKPDRAGKKPDIAAKKPDRAGKKPDIAAKKPDRAGKKPDLKKKPNIKKPQAKRPAGNALKKGNGAKAKAHSKRGKASAGKRSATKMASKKPAARKPAARKGGGGGGKRRRR